MSAGVVHARLVATAAAVALLAAGWAPPGAGAVVSGQSGKIAFASDRDAAENEANVEIYTMNGTGSGQTRLTHTGLELEPAWSPDGRLIAFTSFRDGNSEIYAMNAGGSGQTNLTNNPAADGGSAWSPDGKRIAFQRDSDIFVMNADGSGQTPLTTSGASEPAWSPDGQRIAFVSGRDGNSEIYVMNADGSGQTNLTNNPAGDFDPAWSPDGQRIAFYSERDGSNEIYVMNANGSGPTNLTNSPTTADREPAWSPDGQQIAFRRFDPGGPSEIYVLNANGLGQPRNLTNNAAASDIEPDWQSLPSCPDVQVGFATAQGCFDETEPGSGIFETDEKAWVGGFEIQPRAGGKLVLDTNAPSVSESGAGVDVLFAGFAVPLPVAALPVGFAEASVELNQPGTAEKVLLDLPMKGTAKVAWADGGKSASFDAEIDIDELTHPIGKLVTVSDGESVEDASGKLQAKLVNGTGFVLQQAEVKIDEINVIPRALKVPRTLKLKNLLLKFELKDGKPFWTGQAGIGLPLTRGELDVTGTVFVFDRAPAGGGLAVDGINKPIPDTPLVLQKASGAILLAPEFGLDLGVGASLGPRINGKQLMAIDGSAQAGALAENCDRGDDPTKLEFVGKLTPLDPIEQLGLANATFTGRSCIYTGTNPAMELTVDGNVEFIDGALAYDGTQTGFVSTHGADLEGRVTLHLPALPDLGGRAIISTTGLAACGAVGFFDGGVGYRFGDAAPSAFNGCDLGPFHVVVSARRVSARTAGSDSVTVPAGLPLVGFAASGASGPPQVTVAGPGGFAATSPADGTAQVGPNVVIIPVAEEDTTYVFVRRPKAGSWRVSSADPANPLTSVSLARGLPQPKVDGHVGTRQKKFRFDYSLRPIPGQKVTFFERGEGIAHRLGTAKRSEGTISFKPTLATDRKRTIEAEVVQDGLPRDLITVARFKAPPLPKIGKPRLTAKRRKTSLKVSWPKVRGASQYLVELSAGDQLLYRVLGPKHRLRFSGTPEAGKLKLTVQAISDTQPPGPVAKLKAKAAR